MTLTQTEKIEFSLKVSRIATDLAQANTYTLNGKYREGHDNLGKVEDKVRELRTYLNSHVLT